MSQIEESITTAGVKRDRSEVESLPSEELLSIVHDVRENKHTTKERAHLCRTKYPDFVERYPHLFEMICEPEFDLARFEYMIRLRDDIQERKRTLEDASKEIGQNLFDVYVKPKL